MLSRGTRGQPGNPGNRLHLVSGIAVIDVGRNMEPFGHIQCDNRSGGGGMLSDGPVSQHIDHLIVDHIGPRVNGRQGAAPGHNRGQAGQIIVNLGQKFLHRLLAEGGLVGGSGVPRHLRGRVGQALFIPLYAVLKIEILVEVEPGLMMSSLISCSICKLSFSVSQLLAGNRPSRTGLKL